MQLLDPEQAGRPILTDVVLDAADRVGDQTLTRRIVVRNIGQDDTAGGVLGLLAGTACIDDAFLNKCFYAVDGSSIAQLPLPSGAEVEVELFWSYDPGEDVDDLNPVWFTNGPANEQTAMLRVHTKADDGNTLPPNGGSGVPQGGSGAVGAPDEFGGVRGLLGDNLFMSETSLDAVNRMNGNLTVTIPVGAPLPVGPSFVYQLALVHNSNKWMTRSWEDIAPPDPLFNGDAFTVPVPANAGLGWNLSLGGELYVNAVHFGGLDPRDAFPYDWPSRGEESWVYVDASGGSHPIGGLGFGSVASDGSNIRVQGNATSPLVEVELPSGLVQTFERYSVDCPAVNAAGLALCRRLSSIRDSFGNSVTIAYSADGLTATITDDHARRIVVRYRPFEPCDGPCPLGLGGQISSRKVVDEVDLPATDDRRAVWDFVTQDRTINRSCEVTENAWTANELRIKVPILERLRFLNADGGVIPHSGSYEFGYFDLAHAPLLHCKVNAGELVSIQTPSRARIEYDYTNVFLPIGCSSPNNNEPPDTARGRGILERRVLRTDPAAAPKSTQRFRYHLTDRGSTVSACTRDNTMQTHVVHGPAQDFGGRKHYRHEVSFHTLTQTEDNLPPGGDWRLRDHGLPITKNLSRSIVGAFGKRLYQSSMVFDCDHDGTILNDLDNPEASGCELHRETYSAFAYKTHPENCASPAGRFLGCRTLARPLIGERRVHGDAWIETRHEGFDGYGQFRTVTTRSSFTGPTVTTSAHSNTYVWAGGSPTFHEVAVGADDTLDAFLPGRASVDPWLVGLYDRQESNPDGAVRKATFEFDPRGFLECRRTFADFGSGAKEQDHDVTTRFVDEASAGNPLDGRPDREEWAGGDGSSRAGCDLPAEFALEHSYERGQLAESRYVDAGGGQVGPLLADDAFDASTGLVEESCDHSVVPELCVRHSYDLLGRKTLEDPVGGRGVRRQLAYELLGSGGGRVTVTELDDADSGELSHAELRIDEFGRDSLVRRKVPEARKDPRNAGSGAQWIRQEQFFFGNDQVSQVTGVYDEAVWVPMNDAWAARTRHTFSAYDIHDRPIEYKTPKGEEVDFAYFGGASNARVLWRPFGNGTVRTERRSDHLGRVSELFEGIVDNDVENPYRVTSFSYQNGVVTAARSDGTITQQRKRALDGRAYLVREELPEKGGAAGALTYEYDSQGNRIAASDNGTDLTFEYDRAGRLETIKQGTRPLESREYHGDLAGGRLERARRYNYFFTLPEDEAGGYVAELLAGDGTVLVYEVEDAFTYDDLGNVESKETRIERVKLQGFLELDRTPLVALRATWTYDESGRVIDQTHPECFDLSLPLCTLVDEAGLRRLDLRHEYDLGELIRIDASDDSGPSPTYEPLLGFAYHPSGGVRRIDRYSLRGTLLGHDERLELVHLAADPPGSSDRPDLTLPRVGSIEHLDAPGGTAPVGCTAAGGPLWTTGDYAYDGRGQISRIDLRSHRYDALGRLEEVQASPGGVHPPGLWSYGYDVFDNLLSGDNPAMTFTVEASSNRLATVTLPGGTQPVAYDGRGNLTDAVGSHSRYDPFGRAKTWWWDFTEATDFDYQGIYIYGPDGSRVADISRLPTSTDPNVGIVDPDPEDSDGNGSLDGDFSEILVTFHDPGGSPLRQLRWTDEVTATTSRSLAVGSRTYVGRHALVVEGSDGTRDVPYRLWHLSADHLGTPRYARVFDALASNAQTACNKDDAFTAYGFVDPTADPARSEISPGFSGHWNDRNGPNLQLPRDGNPFTLDMGARSYLPDVGRFLSVDPARDASAWSLYAYAANDPVNGIDTDGRRVKLLNNAALDLIRSTLSPGLRDSVSVGSDGFVSVRGTGRERNFHDLKALVELDQLIEVDVGPQIQGMNDSEFLYEIRDPTKGPTLFLGFFAEPHESPSGNPRVTVSDGTGAASAAPAFELTVTLAHELYGHGLLFFRPGLPFRHAPTLDGPADIHIDGIEIRTGGIAFNECAENSGPQSVECRQINQFLKRMFQKAVSTRFPKPVDDP